MTNNSSQNITIGIFGGGQLGSMLANAAKQMGYKTIIFTDDINSPAIKESDEYIISDYHNQDKLLEFAQKIDIATLEFENIPSESIKFFEKNRPIFPGSKVLNIANDRFLEKSFFKNNAIKTAKFAKILDQEDFRQKIAEFHYRAILKTNRMGYDGKGQFVISDKNNLPDIDFTANEYILEEFIDFQMEISVMVARNKSGEISCYDPLENKHKNGILDISIYPANISNIISDNAKIIASEIIKKLDMVGLLGVEFFVLKDGQLLVNEMAPRPHNSGHFSMDGAKTSQFQQLIRVICDLPLGSTDFIKNGYMKNLIGSEILEAKKLAENKNAKIYSYNKDQIKEGRKMGHINFLENKND